MSKRTLVPLLLALLALTTIVPAKAASTIPFDGMYVKYAGSGTVTMNDKTGQVQLTGSVVVNKATSGYSVVVSFSLTGLPQPPYIAARSVQFMFAENTRILSQTAERSLPASIYNPIWIPVPAPVGSSVQIGPADSPSELRIVATEPFEALGKSVKCVVARTSQTITTPDYSIMIDATAYYEESTGLLMGGSVTVEFSKTNFTLKAVGTLSAVETNAEIGVWPWYIWLVPVVVAILAVFAALLMKRRRRKGQVEHKVAQKVKRKDEKGFERHERIELGYDEFDFEETITCKSCGAKMPPSFSFCAVCGANLSEVEGGE